MMSCTTSQPIATCPSAVSTIPLSSNARSMTTVLATETAMPRIKPLRQLQPIVTASPMQARVAAVLCASAPGIASERTASRSFKLKCRPTPNISRITPISASWDAIFASPTTPGV